MSAASPVRNESATDRPVRLAARHDVTAVPMEFRGRRYWHLKDPVSLRYYQLREEEHFVWGLLDGQRSLHDIVALANERFAPRRLQDSQLYGFLALLHREGLVAALSADQGERLLERGRMKRREAWLALLTNPLAIRFRGVNPSRLLSWMSRRVNWMFHGSALVLLAACLLAAATLLIPRWSEFVAGIPSAQAFFQGDNLLWLAIALAFVKIVHELAHGLACKHFGAECTELGLMLLVFTPCLYCNVSDAWTLPNKWQRILVSAAGMLAELALASLATFVWIWTEPGAIHSLSLRVMLVCSFGTLLLNGNPLLRYDGYYVLADWLEIPNLQAQSTDALRRVATRWLLGIELHANRLDTSSPSLGLAIYGLASLVYRIMVLTGVVWFLYSAMVHNGFRNLGNLFPLAAGGAAIAQIGRRAAIWLAKPRESRGFRFTRRSWVGVGVAVGLPLLLFVPLPCRVSAPAVLRPRDQSAVYAPVGGQLVASVEEGDELARDTVLATLHNRELSREIMSLTGQRAVQVQQIANLRRQRIGNPQLAAELLAAEATLEAIDGQLQEQKSLEARLTVKSPCAGVVIPPPIRPPSDTPGRLSTWSGTPFGARNRGAYIEAGTLLCHVGDPHSLEAIAVIDPAQVELVKVGQQVNVYLAGGPVAALAGEVVTISEMNLDASPPELVATGDVPAQTKADRQGTHGNSYYEAIIRLEPNSTAMLPGVVGRAKIQVASQSLVTRFRRLLGQTINVVY